MKILYFFSQKSHILLVMLFFFHWPKSFLVANEEINTSLRCVSQEKRVLAASLFNDIKTFCVTVKNALGSALNVVEADKKKFDDLLILVDCWGQRQQFIIDQLIQKINWLKLKIAQLKGSCQGGLHHPIGGWHGAITITNQALYNYANQLQQQLVNQQQYLINLEHELENEQQQMIQLENQLVAQQQNFLHVLADIQHKIDGQIITLQQNNELAKESFDHMYSLLLNAIGSSHSFVEDVAEACGCDDLFDTNYSEANTFDIL